MSEIINLRRARKQKAREQAEAEAAANRAAHGRTKVEKSTTKALTELERRRLDAHKRNDDEPQNG